MGLIYLYTGEGGGKTTNALGLALRALGHGQKVVMIQFLKWWKNTGECLFKHPNYLVYLCGREGWKSRSELNEEDKKEVEKGLWTFNEHIRTIPSPDLIILDELNLAIKENLVSKETVLTLLKDIPERTTIVITGRDACQELIDRADVVNEIKEIKAPKKFPLKKGVQY